MQGRSSNRNFFSKITFNEHTNCDSRVLKIYGIQLFLPCTKEKTHAAAICIGSQQSMPGGHPKAGETATTSPEMPSEGCACEDGHGE